MAKLELSEKRQAFVKKAEEYYNALRTNIQLSGDKLKVIAVSSVRPGEGNLRHQPILPGLLRVLAIKHSLLMQIFEILLCLGSSCRPKKSLV